MTGKIEYDSRARTHADLKEFLQHDPEKEEWQRLAKDGELIDIMRDTVAFLESVRKGSFLVTDDWKMGRGDIGDEGGR